MKHTLYFQLPELWQHRINPRCKWLCVRVSTFQHPIGSLVCSGKYQNIKGLWAKSSVHLQVCQCCPRSWYVWLVRMMDKSALEEDVWQYAQWGKAENEVVLWGEADRQLDILHDYTEVKEAFKINTFKLKPFLFKEFTAKILQNLTSRHSLWSNI